MAKQEKDKAEKKADEKAKEKKILDKDEKYQEKLSTLDEYINAPGIPSEAKADYQEEKKKLEEKYKKFQSKNKEVLDKHSKETDSSASSKSDSAGGYNITLDKAFLLGYEGNTESYYKNLESGLAIKDLRGILGMPAQFLPNTDSRIDGTNESTSFGRVYSERIIKNIPLLLITPGVPSFMSSFSKKNKKQALKNIFKGMEKDTFNDLMESGSGKYYSLKYDYVNYFNYVNTMLRSAAVFLGIENIKVDNKPLGEVNWLYHTIDTAASAKIYSHGNLSKFLGPYSGCIAMYADCGNTVSDSFSNSTGQSSLSSSINGLSDTAREMNFIAGTIGATVGKSLDKFAGQGGLEDNIQNLNDVVNSTGLGGRNMLTSIINKAQTLLAGGKLIFPEIWTDSSFSRSYQCNMKLVAPAGDKLSVYLYILIPIYHLIALTLPRESVSQAYYSPFLVRCYYKGLFNVDMGIITDLSVTKGAEGEWTVDGLPTVADVSFGIKDLYDGMAMTKGLSAKGKLGVGILSNITELDYIANSCGVNINDQDIRRMFRLWKLLFKEGIKDTVTNGIFGSVVQSLNNKIAKIFGVF